MRNHIIFFSGGKSSFTVAHLVKERHPEDNILLYFTDTLWEDEDLYRFIYEASDKLKLPMLYHSVGLTPPQLMVKERFMYNSRVGNCSKKLKMEPAAKFFKKGIKPAVEKWHNEQYLKAPIDPLSEGFQENTSVYFGIGWEEAHREGAIKKNWQPFDVQMPLIDEVIDNEEVLKQYGIRRPRLYDMGFVHNNCFAGKERFITKEGLKTFEETVGQQVEVMGEEGTWQQASIKSFGKQQIVELLLEKGGVEKIIETTAGHRWFIRESQETKLEVLTKELQIGDSLWSVDERTRGEWKVKEVRYTDRVEDVFCAVVPNGEKFVLEDCILTGNCKGRCVKAGQGHFKNLLMKDEETFQELKEQEIVVSFYIRYTKQAHYKRETDRLFDEVYEFMTTGKKTPKLEHVIKTNWHTKNFSLGGRNAMYSFIKTMPLEELERKPVQCDIWDIGGCGCFVDYGNENEAAVL